MKKSYEYKVYRRRLLYSLLILSVITIVLIPVIIYEFSKQTDFGNLFGTVYLIFLLLIDFVVLMPYIICFAIWLSKLRSFDNNYETHIVKFNNVHLRYFIGQSFSFQVRLNDGNLITLKTRHYFRPYGVSRNTYDFLYRDVEIAYSPKSKYAIVMKRPGD